MAADANVAQMEQKMNGIAIEQKTSSVEASAGSGKAKKKCDSETSKGGHPCEVRQVLIDRTERH